MAFDVSIPPTPPPTPPPPASPHGFGRPGRPQPPPTPPGTGTVGMFLFLVSLSMLFGAGMIGYAIIRLAGQRSPHAGALHLPHILWLSTLLVICVSVTMGRAVAAVRRERMRAFSVWLTASLMLAIGFLVVQTPAMITLLMEHARYRSAGLFLYGLIFFLIMVHALHVLGGMIALVRVRLQAHRGVYDHEHYQPVRHTAMYWHFLDVIWILMFVTFLATA
jgi:cytochrome c oxidase subunit III